MLRNAGGGEVGKGEERVKTTLHVQKTLRKTLENHQTIPGGCTDVGCRTFDKVGCLKDHFQGLENGTRGWRSSRPTASPSVSFAVSLSHALPTTPPLLHLSANQLHQPHATPFSTIPRPFHPSPQAVLGNPPSLPPTHHHHLSCRDGDARHARPLALTTWSRPWLPWKPSCERVRSSVQWGWS